jgi:hypothetical protein
MAERYKPPSPFLREILAENAPLEGNAFAEANLRRLIVLTTDKDRANRDWATMLLAYVEQDTPEIRQALLAAATDDDEYVRGEAVLGLAARDPAVALPFVQAALQQEFVCLQTFEAAAVVAHPSLIDRLRNFTEGGDRIDQLARDALVACERAASAG